MSTLPSNHRSVARTAGRLLLGAFLLLAGISHLTVSRVAFRAQVPRWVPVDADFVAALEAGRDEPLPMQEREAL